MFAVTLLGDAEQYMAAISKTNRGRKSIEATRDAVHPPLICSAGRPPWRSLERDSNTGNVFIDQACHVEDQTGKGLLWYIPGATSSECNRKVTASIAGIDKLLMGGIRWGDLTDQRSSSYLFKDRSEVGIVPRGTINFSPAWYPQGGKV
jgi:hypothetical protein